MTYAELQNQCATFGLQLSEEQLDAFRRYAALLKEWNEKMNLTSIVEEEAVIEKHFYDSLLAGKSLSLSNRKIADVGSGAGFPGLALAIAYPSSTVTLIDATKKKFAFLEEVKNALGLNNVRFLAGRVEELRDYRESFDVVISRGFAALRVFAEVGTPLLYVTGTLIAMKGPNVDEEILEAKNILSKLSLRLKTRQEDTLPCGDKRITLYYAKDAVTPKRFPRRWDEIQRVKI